MRKIVYSSVLKLVAVILFVACVTLAALTVTNGIVEYDKEEMDIYSLEKDFSDSWYPSCLLDEPEYATYTAYQNAFRNEYETNESIYGKDFDTEYSQVDIVSALEKSFEEFYYSDEVNYFVQWNGVVITNCGAESAEELMQGEYYSYVKKDGTGEIVRESTANGNAVRNYFMEEIERLDKQSTLIISCNIKEETIKEGMAMWERQERIVIGSFVQVLICAVAALLLFIYLLGVCGKNKDGEHKNMWIDNVFAEIHLAAIAGAGAGGVALCTVVLDEYMDGHFPYDLLYLVIGVTAALGSLIIITSLLSIVRNIKTRKLTQNSIIIRGLIWMRWLIVRTAKWIIAKAKDCWTNIVRLLSKKSGIILISMLFIYTALIGLLGIGTVMTPICLVLGVLVFGFACFVVAYRSKDLDEVKKGVGEVRNGNITYKIPELKCSDMQLLALDVNDIADGIDEAVSAKVKAERLKSELITNVSHDLKTPITSIISYTELLSKMEDLPEEAKDYVSVIAKKSDRLKKLTQDLFDVSKAQSGNEDVVFEKLDVALLINQALAEQDNEIQNSGLPFCVDAPKELYISADGRKMSRVLSNLISNILKYTMKSTRVFITASEKNGEIEIEFKNISSYPLDFDVEEITQRFVRGDESRTAEGNGLGLAIAKSYTELCNGKLEIAVDGDMFKSILKFKKV